MNIYKYNNKYYNSFILYGWVLIIMLLGKKLSYYLVVINLFKEKTLRLCTSKCEENTECGYFVNF